MLVRTAYQVLSFAIELRAGAVLCARFVWENDGLEMTYEKKEAYLLVFIFFLTYSVY